MAEASRNRKAVTAAIVGNVLEWYDFAVYAFVAGIIARKFFPGKDEAAALLSAFLTYGLGFIARPLGGFVIGRFGDTRGRKSALLLTMFLMAGGTVMIGCLPTFAQVGFFAPLLLVAGRLVQGFSAGGEWGTSTAYIVEWAPPGRRGFFGSLQQMSVVAGLLLGSGMAALMNTLFSSAQMEDWGWRVPFLFGGILGPVGLYLRRTMEETPAYVAAVESHDAAPADEPSGLALAGRAFGFTVVWTVSFHVLLNYMPTWTQKYLKLSAAESLWSNTIGLLVLLIAIPLMGRLSDRVGRRPVLLTCCVCFLLFPVPIFHFLTTRTVPYWQLVAVQVMFAVMISMFSGTGPSAIAEIFPTRRRSTWMTSGYALAVAIFGGFAPYISVSLIDRFHSPSAHSFYLVAAAIFSTLVISRLRETAFTELR